MSGRCKDCAYWDANQDWRDVRKCRAVPQYWNVTTWSKEGGRVVVERFKNALAFAQDGSDYKAELLTKAEFGCVQFVPLGIPVDDLSEWQEGDGV